MQSAVDSARPDSAETGFRELFEEAPIGMAVVSLGERFLQVNARFCEMVGYSAAELRERTAEDITFRDDVEDGRQLAQALIEGTPRYTGDKRYVHKGGRVLWVSRTACLMRGADGKADHFLLMVEDISERKRSERELQESRRELEAALHANQLIMDNSLDVICTIAATGEFLSVNAACQKLWGYTPAEMIGRKYIEFVHGDDLARAEAIAREILSGGAATDFVNRYLRKDGSAVHVLWSATWSAADGIMYCVAHDVTERSRDEKALREAKEEADRANHAKSEFLSRMSHELRTPLHAILGFSQLLERQSPSDEQRPRVRHILNAGRHLLSLIDEVLDISRIEAGHLQLSLEPVALGNALTEAIDLIRPLAIERRVNLSVQTLADAQAFVLADQQRLKQVLLNLLTNAVKYTPAHGNVTLSWSSEAGDRIRVLVKDTGPGFAPDQLPRLFTPFDRMGAEQSNVEGTGLGLPLSQRLIHAMNGLIGVESAPGDGSVFWIELPHAQSPLANLPRRTRESALSENATAAAKRRVLYIEDNSSNLTLIEQLLAEQPSIELITAMQGRVGLDLALRHPFHLVLLDLNLPDVPGWEVLARLKASESTRDIPVVVMSADATAGQIKRLLAGGAHSYLTKPLDVSEFFRVLTEIGCAGATAVAA